MAVEVLEQLYEGKAKKVFKTSDDALYMVEYKDDATAFNGEKRGTIEGKGVINNKMSAMLFKELEKQGIETHLVEFVDDTHQLVKRVEIVPLEVIARNVIAGSLSKRVGRPEGEVLPQPILEFSYKNDDLGDPMINRFHATALGLATDEEIDNIIAQALKINELLQAIFDKANLVLVDFKLEFGRTPDGKIILADEISPDTCRLWDKDTHEKLDKDRFRRDLGGVEEAYIEVYNRLKNIGL
ncbi:MAG: phosphoribosylaminoimidazolesuccinocarboxamide synthase [Peptococcaceae bacterium]|jgi:phosphoribosylaminoimidazole-succinocarboxamide synthase|nr:phosphoribosylaminoimidazolesuccinocarboxamide synthase [Peptococcaceae bacterium]MEE0205534.1 phosphoribosylaminoimidazolesuccinocarboxamide synthase [Peptococcaceae bacterium]